MDEQGHVRRGLPCLVAAMEFSPRNRHLVALHSSRFPYGAIAGRISAFDMVAGGREAVSTADFMCGPRRARSAAALLDFSRLHAVHDLLRR